MARAADAVTPRPEESSSVGTPGVNCTCSHRKMYMRGRMRREGLAMAHLANDPLEQHLGRDKHHARAPLVLITRGHEHVPHSTFDGLDLHCLGGEGLSRGGARSTLGRLALSDARSVGAKGGEGSRGDLVQRLAIFPAL